MADHFRPSSVVPLYRASSAVVGAIASHDSAVRSQDSTFAFGSPSAARATRTIVGASGVTTSATLALAFAMLVHSRDVPLTPAAQRFAEALRAAWGAAQERASEPRRSRSRINETGGEVLSVSFRSLRGQDEHATLNFHAWIAGSIVW